MAVVENVYDDVYECVQALQWSVMSVELDRGLCSRCFVVSTRVVEVETEVQRRFDVYD